LLFLYDIEAGNFTALFNLIILAVCRYIYVCKCVKKLPTTTGAISKVKEIGYIDTQRIRVIVIHGKNHGIGHFGQINTETGYSKSKTRKKSRKQPKTRKISRKRHKNTENLTETA